MPEGGCQGGKKPLAEGPYQSEARIGGPVGGLAALVGDDVAVKAGGQQRPVEIGAEGLDAAGYRRIIFSDLQHPHVSNQ